MGQNSSAQNRQSSELPSRCPPRGSQAKQISGLDRALAQVVSNESNLKIEIKTLKTALTHALSFEWEMRASAQDTREEWERVERSLREEMKTLKTALTHALSSEREMRASARDTREEWERVERSLREEIGVLRKGLGNTEKELMTVKKELQEKKAVPFVQRLIQGKGRLVKEMTTLKEPPRNVCAEVEEECVPCFPG